MLALSVGTTALLTVTLTACGGSSKPSVTPPAKPAATTTTTANPAADKTAAESLLLAQADLPAGWNGSPHTTDSSDDADNQKLASCAGASDPAKQTADVNSDDFDKGNAEVSSEVTFAPSHTAFEQDLRALRSSKYETCAKSLFDTLLQAEMTKNSPGVTVSNVTLSPLGAPTYGEGSVGLRVGLKLTGPTGQAVRFYVDEIQFGAGRAEVSLTFSSQDAPFDQALEKSLIAKAGSKLKTTAA
jgi:hypothetical protein